MRSKISATSLLEEVSGQAEGAEVYEERTLALPVTFRAGALESVKAVETAGRAVRVISDGRLGYATTTDLTVDSGVAADALESALFGDRAPFDFPVHKPVQAVQCYDPEIERLDEAGLIVLGEEVVAKMHSYDSDLQVDVIIERKFEDVAIYNTSGLAAETRRSTLDISLGVVRTRGDDILNIFDSVTSRLRDMIDGIKLADSVIERLRWAEETATVQSGAMPVVFTGYGILSLVLPLIVGLNGRNVYLGSSPLAKKLGQQAFDPRFTFIDDGVLDYAVLSTPFDDEGTPTARKTLIGDGVVDQFLYDLRTAASADAAPTGNGFKASAMFRSGYKPPTAVSPATSVILPGDQCLRSILENLDEALLVNGTLGLGQGNVLAGEFSNNVALGYLVRKGEVVGRVKDTMIAGNAHELLNDQLIALSNRSEWVFGLLHAPAIAVDGVGVASQG